MVNSFICAGKILTPHGLNGLVRLKSFTNPIENIFKFSSLVLIENEDSILFHVDKFHSYQNIFLVKFDQISDRTIAKQFANKYLFVGKNQLPPLLEGEFYWNELIGYQVNNENKFEFGKVVELIETGGKDVMRIVGYKEFFIPFVLDHYVKDVDKIAKTITVEWEAGW